MTTSNSVRKTVTTENTTTLTSKSAEIAAPAVRNVSKTLWQGMKSALTAETLTPYWMMAPALTTVQDGLVWILIWDNAPSAQQAVMSVSTIQTPEALSVPPALTTTTSMLNWRDVLLNAARANTMTSTQINAWAALIPIAWTATTMPKIKDPSALPAKMTIYCMMATASL